jgi:hypothetical protein
VFDDQILALGESELAQFSKERRIARSKKREVGSVTKKSDPAYPTGLLRARLERPCRCRTR